MNSIYSFFPFQQRYKHFEIKLERFFMICCGNSWATIVLLLILSSVFIANLWNYTDVNLSLRLVFIFFSTIRTLLLDLYVFLMHLKFKSMQKWLWALHLFFFHWSRMNWNQITMLLPRIVGLRKVVLSPVRLGRFFKFLLCIPWRKFLLIFPMPSTLMKLEK